MGKKLANSTDLVTGFPTFFEVKYDILFKNNKNCFKQPWGES